MTNVGVTVGVTSVVEYGTTTGETVRTRDAGDDTQLGREPSAPVDPASGLRRVGKHQDRGQSDCRCYDERLHNRAPFLNGEVFPAGTMLPQSCGCNQCAGK